MNMSANATAGLTDLWLTVGYAGNNWLVRSIQLCSYIGFPDILKNIYRLSPYSFFKDKVICFPVIGFPLANAS